MGMDSAHPGLAALYEQDASRLIGELYVVTGDVGLAEELVAEAFARAVPRWDTIRQYDEPAAWIRHVALNLSRSQWRRVRRLSLLRERHDGPARDTPPEPLMDLASALAALPVRQRQAVVLHYLLGYPVKEAAAVLEVPEGTVKAWLFRARDNLKSVLAEEPCHD